MRQVALESYQSYEVIPRLKSVMMIALQLEVLKEDSLSHVLLAPVRESQGARHRTMISEPF
jgi:hypothetical protein